MAVAVLDQPLHGITAVLIKRNGRAEHPDNMAMVTIVVLTLFNTFGIKLSEWFANIGTVLKIVGIYALLLLALFLGDNAIFGTTAQVIADTPPAPDNLAGAFVGVLWSYTGWHYASFVSGDAINPKRNRKTESVQRASL